MVYAHVLVRIAIRKRIAYRRDMPVTHRRAAVPGRWGHPFPADAIRESTMSFASIDAYRINPAAIEGGFSLEGRVYA